MFSLPSNNRTRLQWWKPLAFSAVPLLSFVLETFVSNVERENNAATFTSIPVSLFYLQNINQNPQITRDVRR